MTFIMTPCNKWIFSLKLFNIGLLMIVLQVKFIAMKLYERCELADELRYKHNITVLDELAQWICIAEQSSGLNTAIKGHDSHGLFAISEIFWCSPNKPGGGCNITCSQLRDNDITDDLICAKIIYAQHEHLSGNGYTAWPSYEGYCKQNSKKFIENCFDLTKKSKSFVYDNVRANSITDNDILIKQMSGLKKGKIYEPCELARDLYEIYEIPLNEVPIWTCIANYESHFNTSAIGRQNKDGSFDYGLFQINDKYWCYSDNQKQSNNVCNMPCSYLLDNDITDDVQCIKRIHKQHTALTGDGFTAWSVYITYCRDQHYDYIDNCFPSIESEESATQNVKKTSLQSVVTSKYSNNPFLKPDKVQKYNKNVSRKFWTRCSLAQELYFNYKIHIEHVAYWVCIAEDASQFNTRLIEGPGEDGSFSHGLFQINDRYWCSRDAKYPNEKACKISCSKLRDQNLSDDVQCLRTIYDEHQRISGNGFNAWTFYKQHCHMINVNYIEDCFEKSVIENSIKQTDINQSRKTEDSIGKVYEKCELAQELYYNHAIPLEQLPIWVCIAEHESNFHTASVGRLNGDGSLDHGLFQISDLYWCSHNVQGGKGCNIPCNKLLDADITDDVQCITKIYEEHTIISGNGFDAWTVYKPYCKGATLHNIKDCFLKQENNLSNAIINPNDSFSKATSTEKIYVNSSKIPKTDKVSTQSTQSTTIEITLSKTTTALEKPTKAATTKWTFKSNTTTKQRPLSVNDTIKTTPIFAKFPHSKQKFNVNTIPTRTPIATLSSVYKMSLLSGSGKTPTKYNNTRRVYKDWSWQIDNSRKSNVTTKTTKQKSANGIRQKPESPTILNDKSINAITSAYNWALYGQRIRKPNTTPTTLSIKKPIFSNKNHQEVTTKSTMTSSLVETTQSNNPFDHPFFDKHRKLFEN